MRRARARLRLTALAFGALVLAGCQAPVRPTPDPAPDAAAPASATRTKKQPPEATKETRAPAAPVASAGPPTGADVFARLNARLSAPICIKGERNQRWRRRYAGYPAAFSRHMREILPLLAYVVDEVERRDLPGEFALIPIVESWYRPEARGPGGPTGMWQMIAATARSHGVTVAPGYDGRLSPVQSTDAALAYLDALYQRFGNWRAAAAGYNAGEYRVARVLRQSSRRHVSGERRQPHGLSSVTYEYIAKLRALSCLIARPERHGIELPLSETFDPLVVATLPPGGFGLDAAAGALSMAPAALRRLNPAYLGGRVAADAPRQVLVPASTEPRWPVLAALDSDRSRPLVMATGPAAGAAASRNGAHVVVSGDTLWDIAKRYGISISQLRLWNGLGGSAMIRPGQALKLQP